MAFITPIPKPSSHKPQIPQTTTHKPPLTIHHPPQSRLQHPSTKPLPKPPTDRNHTPIPPPPPTPPPIIPTISLLTLLTAALLLSHPLPPSLTAFITGPHLPIILATFFSALIQSLTGFGFAIISVATLTNLPWIANSSILQCIQPICATLGALTTYLLLFPEWRFVKWSALTPLLVSSTLLTPLGIALSTADSPLLLKFLGGLIASYVLYSASGITLPRILATRAGGYALGGLAGIFGGMFDITGPPLVVYGDAKRWQADFRRNILTVICFNSTIVVFADLLTGRLQDFYYWDFVSWALPGVLAGIVVGKALSKKLDPTRFRQLVLATCFFVGVKMMIF